MGTDKGGVLMWVGSCHALGRIRKCSKHQILVTLESRNGLARWPGPGDSTGVEFALSGLTPKAIDMDYVFADTGDGNLQKTLAFGRFKEGPFFLGQPMPDASITDFAPGRFAATESFDVILIGLGHREKFKAER